VRTVNQDKQHSFKAETIVFSAFKKWKWVSVIRAIVFASPKKIHASRTSANAGAIHVVQTVLYLK
jgi:hypothetical protein